MPFGCKRSREETASERWPREEVSRRDLTMQRLVMRGGFFGLWVVKERCGIAESLDVIAE